MSLIFILFFGGTQPAYAKSKVARCAINLVGHVLPLAFLPKNELAFPRRPVSDFDRLLWARFGGWRESGSIELRDGEGRLIAFALVERSGISSLKQEALLGALGRLYARAAIGGKLNRTRLVIFRHTHNFWHEPTFSRSDKVTSLTFKLLFDFVLKNTGAGAAIEMQVLSKPTIFTGLMPVGTFDLPYTETRAPESRLTKISYRLPAVLGPETQALVADVFGRNDVDGSMVEFPDLTGLTLGDPRLAYTEEELAFVREIETVIDPAG